MVWLLLAMALAALAVWFALLRVPARLPSDAYVWQRVWTPALNESLATAAPRLQVLHVLALQLSPEQAPVTVAIDGEALRRSGRPVVAVIRIERQLDRYEASDALIPEITGVLDRWRAAGIAVAGIEIDHDSATLRLQAYADWLRRLRTRLPAGLPLTITMLPDWLVSSQLDALMAAADRLVLQVHAVGQPDQGLFVVDDARRWVGQLARRTSRPFQVALPAYGLRLGRAADGSLRAVRAEAATLDGSGTDARELAAAPEEVAAFIAELEARPPPQLSGIIWFRLPTRADRRAWSLPTWLAVLDRQPLHAQITVSAEPVGAPRHSLQSVDLRVGNTGNLDTNSPLAVVLPPDCRQADGVNGYAVEHRDGRLRLQITRPPRLPAQARAQIGWALCASPHGAFDVQT